MAELITWTTCHYYMANFHYVTAHEDVLLIILAALTLILYLLIEKLMTQTTLLDKYGRILRHSKMLPYFSLLLLIGYLIYAQYFFKPDALQITMNNMTSYMTGINIPEMMI